MVVTLLEAASIGLWIVLGIFTASGIVLAAAGALMRRKGVSRKPLYWFAGFMALILMPQFIGHLANAYMKTIHSPARSPAPERLPKGLASDVDYSDAPSLFGPRPGIISVDGRSVASGLLHEADNPKYFVFPEGETVLIGRLKDTATANEAITRFLKVSGLIDRAHKDNDGGFTAERSPKDVVYARAYDNLFTVWSAASLRAIEQLQGAAAHGRFSAPQRENASSMEEEWLDRMIVSTSSTWTGITVIVATIGLYLLLVAVYFFKGIAWATRIEPNPLAPPLSLFALRERVLSLNNLELPLQIEPDVRVDLLVATWRYADARWIDHARAHGMRGFIEWCSCWTRPGDKFGRLISPQFSIGQQALEARLSAGNSSPVLFYSSMSSNESLAFSSTPTADSSRNYRTLTRSTWRR